MTVPAPHAPLQGWSGTQAAGVLTWDGALYRSVGEEISSLVQEQLSAARDLWLEAPARFARRVGLGPDLAAQVPVQWDFCSTAFCRVDFLLDDMVPVVLEINFGTSAGGSIDFEAWATSAGASTDDGPNRERMRWVAQRARDLRARRVVIPVWPWLGSDDPEEYFASTCGYLREFGTCPVLVPLDRVLAETDATRDVLLRLFALQDAHANGFDARQFGYGASSSLTWLCGEFSTALSSKALLASKALQTSGLRAVARTHVLGSSMAGFETISVAEAVARRESLVLKPVDGLGGVGVTFGRATAPDEWAARCAGAGAGRWVAQQVATPDLVPTPHGPCAVVWGMYLVQGRPAGVLARFVPADAGRDRVINGHAGAMLTATVTT